MLCVPVCEQADDAAQYHERQDHQSAVHEKGIGQNGDDGVCCGIEDPIVVMEDNLME